MSPQIHLRPGEARCSATYPACDRRFACALGQAPLGEPGRPVTDYTVTRVGGRCLQFIAIVDRLSSGPVPVQRPKECPEGLRP